MADARCVANVCNQFLQLEQKAFQFAYKNKDSKYKDILWEVPLFIRTKNGVTNKFIMKERNMIIDLQTEFDFTEDDIIAGKNFLKINNDSFGTDCILGKIINTFFIPLFGIVPLFIGLINEKTIFSKILESRVFQILGKSSYIFYLIHLGIFVNIIHKISQNYWILFFGINFISVLLYNTLEYPLNKFFKIKLNKL